MVRKIGKLTALAVSRSTVPGLYSDGAGLYLQISSAGTKSWIFRYRIGGRKTPRDMGLGPLHTISLAEARLRAQEARKLILDGRDPIEEKRAQRAAQALEKAQAITFRAAAEKYIAAHSAGWKNDKHADQWENTLAAYAYPVIGDLAVQAIDTGLIIRVLEPLWSKKTETAARVRGRVERVLDWAKVRGYRTGENPARWRGHLDHLLPARSKVQKVQHHAALPYAEVPTFWGELASQTGSAADALTFTILTAARSGETRWATWAEIDLEAALWTVPAKRMKAGREHRVPLSTPALALLRRVPAPLRKDFLFPGGKKGQPLSENAMAMLLRRMGRAEITVHGFRSTFRDWAAERTAFPSEVAEMALAHVVGDKVEAAYRRGDLFEKRRQMAGAWAKFCTKGRPV